MAAKSVSRTTDQCIERGLGLMTVYHCLDNKPVVFKKRDFSTAADRDG